MTHGLQNMRLATQVCTHPRSAQARIVTLASARRGTPPRDELALRSVATLNSLIYKAAAKKRLGKSVRLDVVRLIETAGRRRNPAPPSRVVIKLPRYDYDEIIDALEGEEDDAADSGGEDYELAG